MTRPRTQRVGSIRRVPSYCYPARRQFPLRWSLALAMTIAWLLVLQSQDHAVRFERHGVVVLDTIEITLVGSELDASFDLYRRAAELAPAPAALERAEFAEAPAPTAFRAGAPAIEAASPSSHGGRPNDHEAGRRAPTSPIAALPATGPRTPEPRPSGDGLDLVAIAGSVGLASPIAARPANDSPGTRDTAPPSYDCLRLCGRGPPDPGVLS
jgi:hypothetical protein